MEKKQAFAILSIDETKDEKLIRQAYRSRLVDCNPEDDPEGFKRLREAYEIALQSIDEAEVEKSKDEIDLIIDKADEIYKNINKRITPNEWKQLLNDEIFVALDTANDARERMIAYLMGHFYLPQDVYSAINDALNVVEDKKELSEKFPIDYLDFFEAQVSNSTFLDYSLIETTGLEPEESEIDLYINALYEVRDFLDGQEYEQALTRIEEADNYNTYHPFMEVEKARALSQKKEAGKAVKLAEKLISKYPEDNYIKYMCAAIMYDNEMYDEAMTHIKSIYDNNNEHFGARYYMAKNAERLKDYKEAKEMILDLLENNPQDPSIIEFMQRVNDELMLMYKESYDTTGDVKDGNEYGWCLFQNEKYQETIDFLDGMRTKKTTKEALLGLIKKDVKEKVEFSEEDEYDFTNLYGRCLFALERYDDALPHLLNWQAMIENADNDGSDRYIRKIRRLGFSYGMIAMAYTETKKYDMAVDYYKKSIELEENRVNRLGIMERMSNCYNEMGEYEKAVDICNEIIDEDSHYLPAYINRQEAYFNLKYGQEVIDDYYNCIAIYPGYFKPYLLAIKVLYIYREYNKAIEVADAAAEHECSNNDIEFYKLKSKRMMTENDSEVHSVIEALKKLLEKLNEPDEKIDDIYNVYYELTLAYMDAQEFENAKESVDKALETKSNLVYNYRWTLGDIYSKLGEYKTAYKTYEDLLEYYGENPSVFYDMAMAAKHFDIKKTVLYLEKVLDLEPDFKDANSELASIYKQKYLRNHNKDDLKTAIDYATKQLELTPNCYYYVERGLIYMEAGMYEKAIEDYDKAIEDRPEDIFAHNNKGFSLKCINRFDEAIEELNISIRLMKEQDYKSYLPLNNLAACYKRTCNFEKALECYLENEAYAGKRESLTKDIIKMYMRLGKEDEMQKYIEGGSEYESIRFNVGIQRKIINWLYINGKKSEAESIINMLYNHYKSENNISCMLEIGEMWTILFRNYPKAKMCFEHKCINDKILENKNCMTTLIRMVECYYYSGDMPKAQKYLKIYHDTLVKEYGDEESYTGFAKNGPINKICLGKYYLFSGQAEKAYNEFFTKCENCYLCNLCEYRECYDRDIAIGQYYEIKGDNEKALEYYKKALMVEPYDMEVFRDIECLER